MQGPLDPFMPYADKPSAFAHANEYKCVDKNNKSVAPNAADNTAEKRVLVCIEDYDSPEASKAIKTAAGLASPDDKIVLMSVVPQKIVNPNGHPVTVFTPPGVVALDYEHERHILENLRKMRINQLQELAQQFPEELRDNVVCHIVHSPDPRTGIMKTIEVHNPMLLVIGRRALGPWERMMSSASVSSFLLLHAPCPLLIVKA